MLNATILWFRSCRYNIVCFIYLQEKMLDEYEWILVFTKEPIKPVFYFSSELNNIELKCVHNSTWFDGSEASVWQSYINYYLSLFNEDSPEKQWIYRPLYNQISKRNLCEWREKTTSNSNNFMSLLIQCVIILFRFVPTQILTWFISEHFGVLLSHLQTAALGWYYTW